MRGRTTRRPRGPRGCVSTIWRIGVRPCRASAGYSRSTTMITPSGRSVTVPPSTAAAARARAARRRRGTVRMPLRPGQKCWPSRPAASGATTGTAGRVPWTMPRSRSWRVEAIALERHLVRRSSVPAAVGIARRQHAPRSRVLQQAQRHGLGQRARLPHRPHAGRAAVLAVAPGDERVRARSKSRCISKSGALNPMPPGYAS